MMCVKVRENLNDYIVEGEDGEYLVAEDVLWSDRRTKTWCPRKTNSAGEKGISIVLSMFEQMTRQAGKGG